MYKRQQIQEVLSALEKMQQAGVALSEACKSLHRKQNVPFDDIWPAVMIIRQLSEREAMQLTKQWCGFGKTET